MEASGDHSPSESKTNTWVTKMRFMFGVLSYLMPTFLLGLVWHLFLFKANYDKLAIYRSDIVIPLGLLSMFIQAAIFAWIYKHTFAAQSGSFSSRAWSYGFIGAVLSWSFTTLAVAAKNVMTSVPDFVVTETAFTIVQWIMVAPLTVLSFSTKGAFRPHR